MLPALTRVSKYVLTGLTAWSCGVLRAACGVRSNLAVWVFPSQSDRLLFLRGSRFAVRVSSLGTTTRLGMFKFVRGSIADRRRLGPVRNFVSHFSCTYVVLIVVTFAFSCRLAARLAPRSVPRVWAPTPPSPSSVLLAPSS